MNAALEMYREDEKVASIDGYNYPVGFLPFSTFFLRGADCWGWATWSRAWKYFEPDGQRLQGLLRQKRLEYRFDLDGSYPYNQMLADQVAGRNQSWAIRWHASMFVRNMYTYTRPALSLRTLVSMVQGNIATTFKSKGLTCQVESHSGRRGCDNQGLLGVGSYHTSVGVRP